MSAAPVQDRIQSLDVMRGFAVLGILAVNAALFAAPWQASANPNLAPLDVNAQTLWSWLAMHVLFEFKCITLFSLLFGASLYLVGGERGDAERERVLRQQYEIRTATWIRPDEVVPKFKDDTGEEMLEAGLFDLVSAFKELLDRRKLLVQHEIEGEGKSLDQAIADLLAMIKVGESLEFMTIFENLNTKAEMILMFIALLELVAGRDLDESDLQSLGAITELVTAAVVNASLYASQQAAVRRLRDLDAEITRLNQLRDRADKVSNLLSAQA